jgi:methylase of polypeptide subunit release factors
MNDGALLLFEVGQGQAHDVASHAVAQGFELIEIAKDLTGIDRVVVLKKH